MSGINMQLVRIGRLGLYCKNVKSASYCLSYTRFEGNNASPSGNGMFISKRNFSVSPASHSSDVVLVKVENGVRKITMNRPTAKNAMSFELMDKLGNALYESNSDTSTKIITVTGAGDFFSSGNDFKNWHTGHQTFPEMKENTRKYVHKQLMGGFMDCQKPIIALVNGPAIGAGATLLPFCDQVLVSDKAFFYTPFPSIGIVPEFCSSYTFPKIMGYSKANDMLLFGHKLTAKESVECGLATKMFPSESFVEKCQKLVDDYSTFPLEPLIKAKELIRAPERETLRHLCAYEMDFVIDAIETPQVRAMIDGFFAKKK